MYIVVGANGFLGSYILKNILEKTNEDVIATARNIQKVTSNGRIKWMVCDIANENNVREFLEEINDIEEKKVIYLAAYHNPDLVEKNPDYAWKINVASLDYFLKSMKNTKCLFYPSSDSVYGNSIDGYCYKESDKLKPVNMYGLQKCEAEKVVTNYNYNVVRYPFLIAKSLSPLKKHFYDVIVETLKEGKEIEMFEDSIRSSISFDTAASVLIDLIENYEDDIPKILNICGDDALSKYEIGLMIAEKIGVDGSLVVPISTSKGNEIFEAKRAQSTLMDNKKIKDILGIERIKLIL